MKAIKVPDSFVLAPFFKKDELILIDSKMKFKEGIKLNPFIFDLYDHLQVEAVKPWKNKHRYIPFLIEMWQETEPIISQRFEERDRNKALLPMKNMILLFIAFQFWVNEQPVPGLKSLHNNIKEIKIKPVNAAERIDYLLALPNHYHAFIQLQQLFIELKKKYAVATYRKAEAPW